MTFDIWSEAVAAIKELTCTLTDPQRELAKIAGIDLPESLPVIVAGARLQTAFASSLGLGPQGPVADWQLEILDELGEKSADICPPLNHREADAWIAFFRLRKRQRALEHLRLESGDVVTLVNGDDDSLYEVSSISESGRINFKGGMRRGAWPDLITIQARKVDDRKGARDSRRSAANQAAVRARIDRWSLAKEAELREFSVDRSLTREDVDHLRDTINSATDEKPIQALVESSPQLLTSLLGGIVQYCIPHVRLGAEWVADFLIGYVDSLGVRWILIEFETPRADVTLRSKNELDRHARKGLSQVVEWREWLQNNLSYARQSKRSNGLGLLDIRASSEGLVIVGRRSRLHDNSAQVRNPIREQNNVRIHTYDWWVEQLEGILKFRGPWGANPFIFQRQDTNDES
jgi:hypothetical protein